MRYTITSTSWQHDREALGEIRRRVFIEEQGVPEEMEWDEFDHSAYHVLVRDLDDRPVGCGRLKNDGQIGRMAVLQGWRNRGIGTAILENILEYARTHGLNRIYLHAQVSAIPFYEKHGFRISGEIFEDAGIPHRTMTMSLDSI